MTGYLEQRAALNRKVAAVVGGGAGIGAGVSMALARAGVDLAICDIDEAGLAKTAAEAGALGRVVMTRGTDATDPEALDAFYNSIAARFESIDIVVNVVGGTRRQVFADASRAVIADDIQRNYGYVVQSVQRAIPLLRRSGRGGSIINFTTIEAHRGAAGFSVYAGAKAATTNFSRAAAVELGKERIRVNCIAPDTTPSRGNAEALPAAMGARFSNLPDEAKPRGMEMYIPRGEAPSVDALGDAVLFLASEMSAFVSGTTLHVDGGTMAAAGFLDWPFGDGWVPCPLAGTLDRLFGD